MTIVARDVKDPDDTDDFTFVWTNVLDTGESITAFTPVVASGTATISDSSTSDTETTARLQGGAEGEAQYLRFRITTSAGRQLDETLVITVRTR